MDQLQTEYNKQAQDLNIKLDKLNAILEYHKGKELHWGHVADLYKVNELLDEVIESLEHDWGSSRWS